jgi:NADPH2:quinone reductase
MGRALLASEWLWASSGMKALVVNSYGPDEGAFRWQDHPSPTLVEGCVLVGVTAVAVDWADLLMRGGLYPGGRTPPFVSGSGFGGTVVESSVPEFTAGTRVFGEYYGGAAAELICPSAEQVFKTPSTLTDVEAAGIIGQFCTADLATRHFGRAGPSDAVLIHAGAGSFGSAALQLCRAARVRTIVATAGNRSKFNFMTELGADCCINYLEDSFVRKVMELTECGADLIIESVGGDILGASFDCIAPLGRLVSVGATSGKGTNRLRLSTVLGRSISVTGFALGTVIESAPAVFSASLRHVIELFESGELRTVIGHVFPVWEAALAHQVLRNRSSIGRTVLTIGGTSA